MHLNTLNDIYIFFLTSKMYLSKLATFCKIYYCARSMHISFFKLILPCHFYRVKTTFRSSRKKRKHWLKRKVFGEMLASSLSLHEGVHVNQGVKTYNMMKIAVVSDHFFVMDRLKEYNIYCRMLTNHVLNPIGLK